MANRFSYQCEFTESVPEHFLCSECKGVARRLTFTSCCGESYCHGCITEIQQKGEPCPACGEKSFTTSEQVKFQRRIRSLQVYCSMKGRGCDWTGTLDNLDAHLDPDGDNCQHVNTKCPFDCQLNVPNNKLNEHVEKECSKRPYTCQHCGFKGTHEEVSNVHLPECKYVPLQCPNLCGVTCDREDMEDHLKICRLEDVACEFSGVGCEDKFVRELEAEHVHMNSQSHLSLTAASLVRENLQLRQALLNQKQEFVGKLEDQGVKLCSQDELLQAQERKIHDLQKLLQNQEKTIQHHDEELQAFREKQQKYVVELKGVAMSLQDQQKKLHEQEKNLEDQKRKLQQNDQRQVDSEKMLQNQAIKLHDHERKIDENLLPGQEKKQFDHEKKMRDIEKNIEGMEAKQQGRNKELRQELQEQMVSDKRKSQEEIQKMQDQLQKNKANLTQNEISLGLTQRFVLVNFSEEKAKIISNEMKKKRTSSSVSPNRKTKRAFWSSKIMYSHTCGYKFYIELYLDGCTERHVGAMCIKFVTLTGQFDHLLKWPVRVELTIELVRQQGGRNAEHNITISWDKDFSRCDLCLPVDEVETLLLNDTLEFNVSSMKFIPS